MVTHQDNISVNDEMDSTKNSMNFIRRGFLFGGCVGVLYKFFGSTHNEKFPEEYWDFQDCILFLETSEEMPAAKVVSDCIEILFEKGALKRLVGIVVAIPKTEFLGKIASPDILTYRKEQEKAIGLI